MATKFYLLNESAPYTPASWAGGWDLDGTITRACDPHKFGSTSTTATRAEAVVTNPYKVGVLRVVSRRLAPQTFGGTLDVVVGVTESNSDAEFYWRLHAYVINSSSGATLGTLVNGYEESAGGGGTEFPTTSTGRALQAAQSVSAVVVPNDADDYRLVVELGVISHNSHTTSRTATIRYGARPSTVGPAHSDLTAGSTSTSTLAGYLEFSGTVSLASDVVSYLTPEAPLTITTLTHNTVMTVDDAGFTHTIWAKYAGTGEVIGFFGFGDLTTYEATTSAYAGISANLSFVDVGGVNKPFQLKTEVGTDYYFRIQPNAGNPTPASLAVNVLAEPSYPVTTGALLVPDDTFGIAALLSPTVDYRVLGFRDFPPGEGGDVLPSGVMVMENIDDTTVDVYGADFTLITSLAINSQTLAGTIRANVALNRFYALSKTPNPDQIVAIEPDGTISATHTLTGVNTVRAIAVSNDGSTLYYSKDTGDTDIVFRWDLDGGAALADLVDAASSESIWDIIVLSDDSILVLFINFSTGGKIRRYDASGSLLNTYDYQDSDERFEASTPPRIARAVDDPDSFWFWRHPQTPTEGISKFLNIRVSDGTEITSVIHAEYELGAYEPAATATPLARFGNSYSCPFFVLASAPPPIAVITIPCCPCDCPPKLNPITSQPIREAHTGNILPPASGPNGNGWTWEPACTGGGDVPSAADATDAESWIS